MFPLKVKLVRQNLTMSNRFIGNKGLNILIFCFPRMDWLDCPGPSKFPILPGRSEGLPEIDWISRDDETTAMPGCRTTNTIFILRQ